jgi:hypothetical protein
MSSRQLDEGLTTKLSIGNIATFVCLGIEENNSIS